MNILFIGDIIGKPGRKITRALLPKIKEEYKINYVIANGENSAGGFGIVPNVVDELCSLGINTITTGNHVWDKKEIMEFLDKDERIIRPINFPEGAPGKGIRIDVVNGNKIAVINVMGRTYLSYLDCPFRTTKKVIDEIKNDVKIIVIDFHAEITSEKQAFGWFFDGVVSAVIGTHTHVPTADERILPKGTGYITDVGMTGAYDSVIGIRKEIALKRFLLQMPAKFYISAGDVKFSAIFLEVDENDGKTKRIERIFRSETS
jgi:metallophosphoesterase (TIGR00282 family)